MILKAFDYQYFKELKKFRKKFIIFFNGCFDIVHPGHLELINRIKNYSKNVGGYIVCGLNSDISIKEQNKSHPLINNEQARAEFLKALGIDYVVIFDEKDPSALIMNIMPDVIFKSEEYEGTNYPERELIIKTGIETQWIKMKEGYSTTNIYNKIKDNVIEEMRTKINEIEI